MLWRKGNTETALASILIECTLFLIPTKNTNTMKVQHDILAAFERGERLTVQKAFRLFHTTELRKVVSRLRREGYDITLHAL